MLRKLEAAQNSLAAMSAAEQAQYEQDYEHFLQDLEEDKEMRSRLNLYKRTDAKAKRTGMDVEGGECGCCQCSVGW